MARDQNKIGLNVVNYFSLSAVIESHPELEETVRNSMIQTIKTMPNEVLANVDWLSSDAALAPVETIKAA